MIATIFMTTVYMVIGVSAVVIWASINNMIIDNMNIQACDGIDAKSKSNVVDSVQSLYTWLTLIIFISFIGIVKGIFGLSYTMEEDDEGRCVQKTVDTYDVTRIPPLLYIAGTIITIFIATLNIGSNPIIKAMTSDFPLVGPDGRSSDAPPIHANKTISVFLTIMTAVSGIAMIGIFFKGKEMLDGEQDSKKKKKNKTIANEKATSKREQENKPAQTMMRTAQIQDGLNKANAALAHTRAERRAQQLKEFKAARAHEIGMSGDRSAPIIGTVVRNTTRSRHPS